jgi:hypothetical protein
MYALRKNIEMKISKVTTLRKRALILLDIERELLFETLGLLGYGTEKAAPVKRVRLTKQPRIPFLIDMIRPVSFLVH